MPFGHFMVHLVYQPRGLYNHALSVVCPLSLSVDNPPSYMVRHRNFKFGTNMKPRNGSHFGTYLLFAILPIRIVTETSYCICLCIPSLSTYNTNTYLLSDLKNQTISSCVTLILPSCGYFKGQEQICFNPTSWHLVTYNFL